MTYQFSNASVPAYKLRHGTVVGMDGADGDTYYFHINAIKPNNKITLLNLYDGDIAKDCKLLLWVEPN